MIENRRHFFTLQEILLMAALAALGGVCSSFVSNIRAALTAIAPPPIGMQPLAGIHVIWFIIAAGLIRKPGAATITGLLGGMVELLSGNPHGLIVVAYSGLGGAGVDAAWILLGGRNNVLTYSIAGGAGAATNVIVFAFTASLPANESLMTILLLMGGVAFASGVVLAGIPGNWLLHTLHRAGIARSPTSQLPIRGRRRTWAGIGAVGIVAALICAATYLKTAKANPQPTTDLQSTSDARANSVQP